MIKIILSLLICVGSLTAQITFEKYYQDVDNIVSVDQTLDGGYVFGTQNKAVIKLDKYGDVQWVKKFQNYNTYDQDVLACSDSTIMVLTTSDGEKKDIFLHKLNYNGNLIWKKRFGTPDDDYGFHVRENSEREIIIFGTQLIKTDIEGIIKWQKVNPVPITINNFVKIGNDGKLFIVRSGSLNCVSPAGDLMWSRNIKLASSYSLIEMQDHLFVSDKMHIHKIDYNGNIIRSNPVSDYYSIAEYDSNTFVIAGRDTMMKLNGQFEILWTKKIPGSTHPGTIKRLKDKGYILTGENGWLLKTDADGNHKSLSIKKPLENKSLHPGHCMIAWSSFDVANVTLEYSRDNDQTWEPIAVSVPNKDSLEWNVPLQCGDYYIRIYDSADPEIRDNSGLIPVHWNSSSDYIAVNQIKMWVGANGMGSHDLLADGPGFYWPGGEEGKISTVFTDGLLWGGRINGKVNVNGNSYRYGLNPGKIFEDGSPDNPNSYKYNVWKINKNWESLPDGDKRQQMKSNYLNWPGELGAPFKDLNKDGTYTIGIDLPDFVGDEVLWTSANDLDSSRTKSVYGCDPIGIEVQMTTYGFNKGNDLDDVVFKKYKLINKGNNTVEDMYFDYYSDPDLGYPLDDFVGCDTVLNMAFCYNSDNDDYYYNANPPAIGYKIVQGPVIGSVGDSAFFNNLIVRNKRNLPIYAFYLSINSNPVWLEAEMGLQNGAEEFYNQMRGKIWNGSDIINPITKQITTFPLSGDPVSGTGWYEGPGWPGGESHDDRRMHFSTGPFTFAPQDTQEVVYAIIMARGEGNIASVAELKRKARFVQEFYNNKILTGVQPETFAPTLEYSLSQNYPNPFNPSTTIVFNVPEKTNVQLKVYDVLGKEIISLVNELKNPGRYDVHFNAQNFASGVYYYQLKTENYIAAKKMVLIK